MSVSEDLVWLTTRTPDNIVVNLADVPDETLAGYTPPTATAATGAGS
jgi:hypothetical protein